MRNQWILLQLVALLTSIILAEEADEIEDGKTAVKLPWMVSVQTKDPEIDTEPLANPIPLKVSRELAKILCAGVIVNSKLVYVSGTCVKCVTASDLEVFVFTSSGDSETKLQSHEVADIIIGRKLISRDHALLVLTKPIMNAQVVSLFQPTDIANSSNCLISEPYSPSPDPFSETANIRKKGEFGVSKPKGCASAAVFFQSTEIRSIGLLGTGSGRDKFKMRYGSPIVCSSQDNSARYIVLGSIAWSNPLNVSSQYECMADAEHVRDWIKDQITSVESVWQSIRHWLKISRDRLVGEEHQSKVFQR